MTLFWIFSKQKHFILTNNKDLFTLRYVTDLLRLDLFSNFIQVTKIKIQSIELKYCRRNFVYISLEIIEIVIFQFNFYI